MTNTENYPQGSPHSLMARIVLNGARNNDKINTIKPLETNFEQVERSIGVGIRDKQAKAMFLASYIPMFLAADAALGGDMGGSVALVVCCALAIYLFSLTSWKNEQPK